MQVLALNVYLYIQTYMYKCISIYTQGKGGDGSALGLPSYHCSAVPEAALGLRALSNCNVITLAIM